MRFYSQRGSAVIMALVLIILILGLSGAAFSLFRFSRERGARPFQASAAAGEADSSLFEAIAVIQKKASEEAVSDPEWAFFFWGGDLNGDGKIARDGELDQDRNGAFDVSPVIIRDSLEPWRIIGRKTLEDTNGNHRHDFPDGGLEDISGSPLGNDEDTGCDGKVDSLEPGYDPVLNPDPSGDNYHPIFNPSGTEGNRRLDQGAACPGLPGETDTNGNGIIDITVEDGGRWIRPGKKKKGVSRVAQGEREAAIDSRNYLKAIEVNSQIDLNGPNHLSARLLNNLFKMITLAVINTATNSIALETLGENMRDGIPRGLNYDPNLDATIGTIDFSAPPASTDPHAVQLIKERNRLPGKRFATKDEVYETIKRVGLLTLNDTDEWMALREFITVHAVADPTVVRQNPADLTGPPILDPRAPVNLNSAPKEVLQAVIMAGFDFPALPGANNAEKSQNAFDAAESLASVLFQYRMGQANPLLTGQGVFKSWAQFEIFMNQVANNINTLIPGAVPNSASRRAIFLANKDRLIAQANPNARLQRFNPDTTTLLPIDKSQIPYPTAEFTFSGDGIYEIRSMALLSSGEILLPPFMAPTEPNRLLSPGGNELARKENVSIVKVYDLLRHTNQEDFENRGDRVRFSTKSYPENQEDLLINIAFQTSLTVTSPGPMAVDEKSGLVYVISDGAPDRVRVLDFDSSPASIAGTLPDPPIPALSIFGLAIAPSFPGTTYGRLYLGATEGVAPKIKIFDILRNTDGTLAPTGKPFHDISLASSPVKLVQGNGRETLFIAGNQIGKSYYPFADPAAIPEADDPSTFVNEATNGMDDDGDGIVDDQRPSSYASPERDDPSTSVDERFDGVDNDLDGVPDDGIFPLPTRPRDSLMLSSCPLPPSFIDLAFDRRLNQAFAVDSLNNLWRIREDQDGRLEPIAGVCSRPLGFTPRGIAIDEDDGETLLTEAAGADLILHRFSSKDDTSPAMENLTLSGLNMNPSDGRLAIDSNAHLIFIIGTDPLGNRAIQLTPPATKCSVCGYGRLPADNLGT